MTTNWKLGLGYSLATVVMWGLLPLALKAVLEAMDPITITWYRFSLSAFIALLWYGRRRGSHLARLVSGRHWPLCAAAVGGLLGNYVLYIVGLDRVTPGAAQILIQLAPLLLLVGSVLIFRESFSTTQWLGVLVFSIGMLLFFHRRLSSMVVTSSEYFGGIVIILAAAVIWCIYGLAQKQLLLRHHAQDILLMICLAGTLALWPAAEPGQIFALDVDTLMLLLFCGINTIIAYGSFGLAMSHWQSSRVSAVITLTPLLTLFFTFALNRWAGAGIAAEPVDGTSIFGAALVVAGSALAALPGSREDVAG